MSDWMWIVLILAALFGGTVYCGFRAIAAALEERAVMSEECSKIMDNLIAQDADLIETQARENERLREALKEAHWFYFGDDCSSDQCRFGIDECISEDFEWDNPAKGDHVLQISGARPVPDMWIALHYFTDAEKDERDDDEPYAYTVHATEEEARAALGDTQ